MFQQNLLFLNLQKCLTTKCVKIHLTAINIMMSLFLINSQCAIGTDNVSKIFLWLS